MSAIHAGCSINCHHPDCPARARPRARLRGPQRPRPLRLDPLFAAACGRSDLLGEQRVGEDQGKALAGKSTLNRLELGAQERDGHYRKINADAASIDDLLLETGVKAIPRKSRVIVLDFDATDDPHPRQPGRPILPRLLPRILLSSALLLLRRHPAVGRVAQVRPRRLTRHPRSAGKDHPRHPQALWETKW